MNTPRPSGTVRYDHSDRVVIVTGAARGIGASIAAAFAESGATVVCADVNRPSQSDLLERVEFRRCDTASDVDCRECVSEVVNQHGAVDVLVNNAAIQPKESYCRIEDIDETVFQRMMSINFAGYMRMAKYTLAVMRQQQSGVIVNIASGQAHRTARQVGVYGPIKSANVMQSRQWAVEYARDGIRVVSVSPGAIDTPMVRANLAEQGGAAALANRHPVGRIGQPDEVAAAVLWLSSSDASFITGTDLEVDGGLGALGAFADPYPMQPPPDHGAS